MANKKWAIDGNKLFELIRDDHRINGSEFSRVKKYMEDSTIDAVEVVHGMWTEDRAYSFDPYSRVHYKCSICGRTEENKEPYCNCGARMDIQ